MLVFRLQPKVIACQWERSTDDAADEIESLAEPSAPGACVELEDKAVDIFFIYHRAQQARESVSPNGEGPRETRQRDDEQDGQSPETETDVAIVQEM